MEKTFRGKNPCSTTPVHLLIEGQDSPPVIDGDDGSRVSEAPIDED